MSTPATTPAILAMTFSNPAIQAGMNRLFLAARSGSDLVEFSAAVEQCTTDKQVAELLADELTEYWQEHGLSTQDVAFLETLRRIA